MQIYKTLENNIKIVEYEDSLAPTIAEMWNQSSESWGGGSGVRTAEQVIREHETLARYNVFIAMDGEEAVGYCSLTRSFFDTNCLYISLLGVRPDYQGKKVGKALTLQCVERTIELGYPKIDIHTWAGNTQAVPLYKKCGYLWEDREDSTYLINYIPSLIKTGLFKPFFAKADWYQDSTKVIEIKPDGIKENKFEVYGYSWEKDGEILNIGFERSGKRMRLIETNDYKISFMAATHEPAFGMHYDATFMVENKSGKELQLEITGKDDGNITFDYHVEEAVKGNQTFTGRFFVGPTSQPQSKWLIHPCVLADVVINGEQVEFGLGIDSKVPIQLSLAGQREVARKGMSLTAFLNIESALDQAATVHVSLPENELTGFANKQYEMTLEAGEKSSLEFSTTVKEYGHVALPVTFVIRFMDDKTPEFTFEYPLHLVNQGLTSSFGYEKEEEYVLVAGPWSMRFNKHRNYGTIDCLGEEIDVDLSQPELGMPFTREFDVIKPDISITSRDEFMVLEATCASEKFPGIRLTQTYALSAAGVVKRNYRIKNQSNEVKEVMLADSYWLPLGIHTKFSYDGKITQNTAGKVGGDAMYGLDDTEPDKIGENWLFEGGMNRTFGICWHPSYKSSFRWGSLAIFEINCGQLQPGEEIETKSVEMIFGIFTDANSFRNYAMNLYNRTEPVAENVIQPELNGHNPFFNHLAKSLACKGRAGGGLNLLTGEQVTLELHNNRSVVREGRIRISSNGFCDVQEQVNDGEALLAVNTFNLPVNLMDPNRGSNGTDSCIDKNICIDAGKENDKDRGKNTEIGLVTIEFDMANFRKILQRGLFFVGAADKMEQRILKTEAGQEVYQVNNGRISFKAAPFYSEALFSLISHSNEDDHEWLCSRYPNHEPYAWDSPFIGGLQSKFSNMRNSMLLKETKTADFTQVIDNFGNTWQGIRTTVTITEFEANKGATLESYYLTMPELPVLCHFYRFVNGTGQFREDEVNTIAMLNGGEENKLRGRYVNRDNMSYEFCFGGTNEASSYFERFIRLQGERREYLYIYQDNPKLEMDGDNKVIGFYAHSKAYGKDGDTFTSKPVFFITTESELTQDSLEDLRRVKF